MSQSTANGATGGSLVLQVHDVVAMMQPSFWHSPEDMSAFRFCAVTALLAGCHILPGHARSIRLENWRPDGQDVVRIWRHHEWQTVHLTPQVVAVVSRFISERNRIARKKGWESEFLFVSKSGTQCHYNDIAHGFKRLRKIMGCQATIPRLLKNFCARQLAKGCDEVASRRYRGIGKPLGDKHNFLPEIPDERIKRLVKATNPFKTLDRQMQDEAAAMKWLAGKDLVVPMQITIKVKTMPLNEPLVAKLLAIQWPRGKHDCRILRSQIWDEYGDEIRALMQKRVLSAPLVARLLHTSELAIRSFIHSHYAAEQERSIMLYKPKPVKAQPMAADRATIRTIERTDMPSDPAERSRAILNRVDSHIEQIEDMIERKVLSPGKAAELLKVKCAELRLVRVGRQHGLSANRLLGRETRPVLEQWWQKVREAHAAWPADTEIEFFCRLVAAGFPGAQSTLSNYVRKHLRPKAPRVELTEQDREIIEALSNIAWSTNAEFLRDERLAAVRRCLEDVDAMVQAGKITVTRASSLLRVTHQRYRYMSVALAAGLTVEAIVAAVEPVSAESWAIVEREHMRTPDEDDLHFLVRMKANHGYVGGAKALRTFRINLRLRASRPLGIEGEEPRAGLI